MHIISCLHRTVHRYTLLLRYIVLSPRVRDAVEQWVCRAYALPHASRRHSRHMQCIPPPVKERTIPTPTARRRTSREDPRARHATPRRARIYGGVKSFVFGYIIMRHQQ